MMKFVPIYKSFVCIYVLENAARKIRLKATGDVAISTRCMLNWRSLVLCIFVIFLEQRQIQAANSLLMTETKDTLGFSSQAPPKVQNVPLGPFMSEVRLIV